MFNPTVRLQINRFVSYLILSYVAGDGAGGNLAAAVALKLRDENWSPALKMQVRGFAKLNKFQKRLDRANPTHPPPSKLFFGKPSLTWTEHSNHINQQLLAMYVQTEYTWYTTPIY